MSESEDQTEATTPAPATPAAAEVFSIKRVLGPTFVALLAAGAAYWYGANSAKPPEVPALWMVGMDQPVEHKLSSRYTDADGDLVADPPADESAFVDPEAIKFSYLATEQDRYAEVWAGFIEFVAQQTGKPVEFVKEESSDKQMQALQNGELHLAGINSGSVPLAVNYCGFVPVCSFGTEDELVTYTMKVIAQPEAKISGLKDVRGKRLALTNPTSNSGWKVPMVLMMKDHNLKPLIDYEIAALMTHAHCIRAVADGQEVVAAVASDELALAESRDQITKADYKVVFESDPFCNNVFGYAYNLKPELAETIRQAMYDFQWKDSQLAEEFTAFGASQLVPVDYKRDFELIRKIDNAMGRRHAIEEAVDMARVNELAEK